MEAPRSPKSPTGSSMLPMISGDKPTQNLKSERSQSPEEKEVALDKIFMILLPRLCGPRGCLLCIVGRHSLTRMFGG